MNEQLRAFLAGVQEARFQYRSGVRRVAELEERCRSITSHWDGQPGGGKGDVRRDGPMSALADQRARLPGLYRAWEEQEERVGRFLDGLKDLRYRAILRLRYVELLHWPRVQQELEAGGIYYSERQMFNLHTQALEAAQEQWNRMQAEDLTEDAGGRGPEECVQ